MIFLYNFYSKISIEISLIPQPQRGPAGPAGPGGLAFPGAPGGPTGDGILVITWYY